MCMMRSGKSMDIEQLGHIMSQQTAFFVPSLDLYDRHYLPWLLNDTSYLKCLCQHTIVLGVPFLVVNDAQRTVLLISYLGSNIRVFS